MNSTHTFSPFEFDLLSDSISNLELLGIPLERVSKDCKTNKSGDKLIEICKDFDLRILDGRFGSDKGVGDFTCVSNNGNSSVDYIIMSSCLLPNLIDFTVDTFDECLSDKHKPVFCTIKSFKDANYYDNDNVIGKNIESSIVNNSSQSIKTKWDKSKANDFKQNFDMISLDNIQAMIKSLASKNALPIQSEIDNICDEVNKLFTNSAIKSGISKIVRNQSNIWNKQQDETYNDKPWFDFECKNQRRKYLTLKNRLSKFKSDSNLEILRKAARLYKNLIKRKKKIFNKDLAAKLRSLKTDDPREFWNTINKTNNSSKKCPISMDKLFNHFNKLAGNVPDDNLNSNDTSFDPRKIDHSINDFINSTISIDEINQARKKLKNNKAGGPDDIINEFIKNCPENVLFVICKLFNLILNTGIIPSNWSLGIVIPIFKNKGSREDPNNYRGITLLSALGKLFTSILNIRLTNYIDNVELLGEEQAGFRERYSTMDHIFVLNCIIDLYLRNGKRLYCAFVGYKKAFDLVDRSALWSKLIANGINGKVITVIYNMYKDAKSCVKSINTTSEYFKCNVGVRQAENLSPLLFAIFLNDLEMSLMKDGVAGLQFINKKVKNYLSDDDIETWLRLYTLLYADDTILLAESARPSKLS